MKFVKIKALCVGCKIRDGIFTHRLSNEKEQLVVGSKNYQSLCRKCYNNRLTVEDISHINL